MSDPDERLSSFDPGLPMNPLPPTEVRRQGDRLRRRNTIVAGVGAALAVALIATPIAALSDRDEGPEPAPGPKGVDWVTAIPADFPLGDGMALDPSIDPVVSGERISGEIVLSTVNICGTEAWRPDDAVDVLGAAWSNGIEGGEQRTLAVYPDDDRARGALERLERTIASCDLNGPSDDPVPLTTDLGEQALAWVAIRDGNPPTAIEAWQISRVGNALLLDRTLPQDTEWQASVDDLAARAGGVVDAMCVFSAEGCEASAPPDATSSPEIPDDFPLLSGWPRDDEAEPGPDHGLNGPSRSLAGSLAGFPYTACGREAPSPAARDYLRATWINVEDSRTRQLLTFHDADTANAEVDRFVDHFLSCPQESSSPGQTIYHELRPVSSGEQSEAIVKMYGGPDGPALGLDVLLVVRVGRAVVIDTAYSESIGTERNIRAQIEGQRSDLAEAIDSMCLFTDAGC